MTDEVKCGNCLNSVPNEWWHWSTVGNDYWCSYAPMPQPYNNEGVYDAHFVSKLIDWAQKITDLAKHTSPICARCELDMVLYRETYFNFKTKEHYDVSEMRVRR